MSPEARRFYCRGRGIAVFLVPFDVSGCDVLIQYAFAACPSARSWGTEAGSSKAGRGQSHKGWYLASCTVHVIFFFFFRFVKKQENVMGGRVSSDAA